ncbi:MAG: 6-bladed beta-propeller, partial [Bradymonadaceae bacterium]
PDGQGRLVVPAYREDTIHVFDGTQTEVDSFGGDWVDAPAGVEVGPDGRYYVADFYNHRFHILAEDGTVEKSVGKKGKKPGQFTYPTDIEVTPEGTIWVADAYAHRIQVFAADGTHEKTIGRKGTDKPGRFHVATGIDRGPDGNLYVADFKNNRVQVLRPDGKPVAVIDGTGEGGGTMKHPTEVVATVDRLYVVDHGNHQVDVYARTGD